ncbi:hypothetical protein F4692_001485 [Nocardioides cavernae]|uniref:PASTA domain-containing protein n=1 Tax=Nocardioides cavernae TaxID=1921566 RepID=A0A7Y9H1S9_9ACTN|nr:hypothetical protein [Nocardioides cavernae]NYE36381.1 hypothetical protein [Nocardioides cavernae]
MRSVRALLAAAACCLALAGCADDDPTAPPGEESSVDETPETPGTPAPPTVPGGGSPDALLAVDDLAAELGVAADQVKVISVEEVTWRNGSRGCAEPGMAYTQALVEGARIILGSGGKTYEYHAGGSRPPTRCARPTE